MALTFLTSSTGLSHASPINVNTATQSELESIKGIGPAKAKTIIAERVDIFRMPMTCKSAFVASV